MTALPIRRAATRSLVALCLLLFAPDAQRALAADLTITLPSFTAPPGAQVDVPIDVSQSPGSFGIVSIDFRMPLDPAVVSASQSLDEGFLEFWGPAYSNGTTTFVAAAAGGLAPVSSTGVRLNTVRLTISPTAISGATMPLTFSSLHLNEGSPSVSFTPGTLHVSGALAVGDGPSGFSLAAPRPDPVRSSSRVAFSLEHSSSVRLDVFDAAGARRRALASGPAEAGPHELVWEARDDRGSSLEPGVYFLRLRTPERSTVRRFVIVR